MKRCEVLLWNMLDIVANCVVLHNLYIVNKKCMKEDWIVETEN